MTESKQVGMVGFVDTPDALLEAATTVRKAGYEFWDCHTPYPVHGLDDAMGLDESPLPYLTIGAGLTGCVLMALFIYFTSVYNYPVRIGGKELWSWPAFVPILFEAFVLFAAITTFKSVILFCRLGRWAHPLHDTGVMKDITCNRFAVVLESKDPQFEAADPEALLKMAGCCDIQPLVQHVDNGETL
jgi:hypothetical protein